VPKGNFPNARKGYRAQMIARTETKYAQNISSLAAYRNADVVTGLMAFDAQAGNTDAECEARNGQVFSFTEADRVTEEEHPNGTLSWAPVTN
jgi:SPP1 gp7 family putative phage head morphogenesis protein